MSDLVFEHVWSDPLKDVSLRASGGVCVILGDESDGTGALVELCAGVREPRRGRVTLGAEAPGRSPLCRRGIASLLGVEAPLTGGDVRQWLGELSALRPVSPATVLESCSVSGDRALRSLSGAERRELACWVALAQADAALVVLHDPLAACGAGQRERALGRIAELGRVTTVLLTTASIAEARVLGGSRWRLDRGLLEPIADGASNVGAGNVGAGNAGARAGGAVAAGGDEARDGALRAAWHGVAGALLTLEADAPRELVAALARHPDVHEIRYDEQGGGRVVLRGSDMDRLARAVARAVVSAGVDIRSLRAGADDLDALRAATTAMNDAAGAAYRAARARGRPAVSATPELGPSPAPSPDQSGAPTPGAPTPGSPERTAPPGSPERAAPEPPEPPKPPESNRERSP